MHRDAQQANLVTHIQTRKKAKIPPKILRLAKPTILGFMSVDVLREYHHDVSQLKFLNSIPKGRLYFDLNHNIHKAVKRSTEENNEKITLLLKFILNQKDRLKYLITEEILFISYRRTLINIMCNINNCTPVSMVASLFNNCIYLCTLESPQEILRRQSCSEVDKFCAWGYKFKQYMLSDIPRSQPDIEKPVIENEEFSMFYYSRLAKHRLFYGAQVDGMMATDDPDIVVPESDDVDEVLAFLQKNSFVELQTQKEMNSNAQILSFKKYKLLRCWCQAYLAGLKGVLLGFRNSDGIIHRVQFYGTRGIPRGHLDKWATQKCTHYLNDTLNFLKQAFELTKERLGENYDTKVPLTMKFDIDQNHRWKAYQTEDEEHIILPSWYVENIEE